jgi:predicted ATPase/DNA-binding SARP family transcriptional activator
MFGTLRVWQGDTLHTRFRSHKAASLLAYLALHLHQAQPRERLLDLFWPEMPPDTARDNLSTTLSQLRRQLEPPGLPTHTILRADRQQLQLNPSAVTVDVVDFDALLAQATRSDRPEQTEPLLEQAIALYQGELLPGHYEEWAVQEQTRCQTALLQSLDQLERLHEQAGRYEAALLLAQRSVQIDAYFEAAYQAQMRLHLRLKRPAAALEVFEAMQARFRQELGVAPSALTCQLAQRIRQDPNAALLMRQEPTKLPTKSGAPGPALSSPSGSAPVTPVPLPSLPLQLTRFYGRRRELAQVQELLETPQTRLVTLLGPGGAGKTRLSLEVAARMQPLLGDRVWFVSLADLPDAGLIPSALMHALRLPHLAQSDPLERVVGALGTERCLLVLDNFEHLLQSGGSGKNETRDRGGAALVRLLLQRCEGLQCLVTSRQALGLGGEQEFVLPPLALPPAEAGSVSLSALLSNESVGLYVDRARLSRADFALTAGNAWAVTALCRKLEGMPLAIEMAAAWAKTVSPGKMLERLEHQLGLLVSRRSDLPARHQSLRATCEWSYALLEPELARLFISLSVFRGGWTLEAAEAVAGDEALMGLAELQERSLIVGQEGADDEAGTRYRMLEPLREFAAEKLQMEGADAAVQRAHADYFHALAMEAWGHMNNSGIKSWIDRLDTEQENLRAALTWQQADNPELALRFAGRLWRLWELRGYAREGLAILQHLLERCGDEPPTTDRAQARHAAGALAAAVGDYPNALYHYEQSLKIAQELGDLYYIAMAKQQCALVAEELGDHETAAGLLEQAITLYQQQGQHDLVANNQCNLAVVAIDQGNYTRARELLTQALRFQRETEDLRSIAITLNNLGEVALHQGDFAMARSCQAESLTITYELGAKRGSAYALEGFASIAATETQWERSVYLWAAAQALREAISCPLTPAECVGYEAQLAGVRSHMSTERFGEIWNEGHSACLRQASEVALGHSLVLE